MNSKFAPFLYGLGVFIVFAILTLVLRLITNKMPEEAPILGIYTTDDVLLGLGVAAILTFSTVRKRNLRK